MTNCVREYFVGLGKSQHLIREPVRLLLPDFTGRAWAIDRIADWLDNVRPRMFIVNGGPGTAKSRLAPRLIQLDSSVGVAPEAVHLGNNWLSCSQFCRASLDSSYKPAALH